MEPDTSRPVSGDPGLRMMEEAFMISKVDSEPLTINRTVFRHDEDNNVEEIPGLMQLPAVFRDCLLRHWSVFANNLSSERKIKCEPIHLTRKPGIELPPKVKRARLTPAHYRPREKEIIEKMLSAGVLVTVDEVTPAVSAGFFVKKTREWNKICG